MEQQSQPETSEVASDFSLAQAGKYLQVHPETIRRWIEAGHLPAKRIGIRGIYRIRRDDLDSMVKAA